MGKMVGDKYATSVNINNPELNDAHEKKIVNEFCHLLEKSKQLFNQLRCVPITAEEQQWQSYFTKSFDIYTRLWKYQQEHREILDRKYSLKRWQIGEIASKIGQLYYHYYLRTSDLNYLNEAHSFYSAIKGRAYFQLEERVELRIKKLRYFCRFIVVCLLLGRSCLDIFQELSNEIEEYSNKYEPEDQLEWSLVLNEIKSFVQAECLYILNRPESFSHRLKMGGNEQRLQEALIVGNKSDQLKFSELTMDMYRILQVLERENSDSKNPKKYLLFRASVENILLYLSNAFANLQYKNILLVYFSADGGHLSQGLQTAKEETKQNCFYPCDFLSYTRKPLCLIIESENSFSFQQVYEKSFGGACVLLLSMQEVPSVIDTLQKGSLFTLFLYDPIAAFCAVAGITITYELYEQTNKTFRKFANVAAAFISGTCHDDIVLVMMSDDFLRELTLRYVFCELCVRMRKNFESEDNFPKSYPNLNLTVKVSQSVAHNEGIGKMQRVILDICDSLAVSDLFFVDYLRAV